MFIRDSRPAASFYRFLCDKSGATAVEYALLGMFIAVAIVASVSILGTRLSAIYADVTGAF